jgi:formamidopyrimidine-DNA glycosylase
LDDGKRLMLHLGMTGQLFAAGAESPRLLRSTALGSVPPERQAGFSPDHHTHLRLAFEDGGPEIMFRDARKFGKVRLLGRGAREARLVKLGVDALEATGECLYLASRGRGAAVKALLLDQGVLAGVGNIYADEALYLAGIRPTRAARRLTRPACERLATAVRGVLERAIASGGSSISDYIAPDGSDGRYQDERRVYARTGEPCLRCGSPVRRILVAQRSSHYCPSCQR